MAKRKNAKPLWFVAKTYGWGWTPATWQGWLITLGFAACYTAVMIIGLEHARTVKQVWLYAILPAFLVIALLLLICYRTGEKPRWRWGK
jgi:hypothetical protein